MVMAHSRVHHAFVALGANLPGRHGDAEQTLRAALAALRSFSTEPLAVSGFYRSDPKDCPPGSPPYVNAVAALLPLPAESPVSLLNKLQQVETAFGRTRSGLRNEPRHLDLDLLTFGAVTCNTPQLILPHPRAHLRRFVLEPWIVLAGRDWPLMDRTLGEWLDICTDPPLQKLA